MVGTTACTGDPANGFTQEPGGAPEIMDPIYERGDNGDDTYELAGEAEACPLYTTEDDVVLKAVSTYHWNGGMGAAPGAIRIYDITGEESVLLGTWEATARGGAGADNVFKYVQR